MGKASVGISTEAYGAHTNDSLLKEARRRWPAISERSFVASRKAAIVETGATEWGTAGATPKSLRRNHRGE
jgi:hypothetical protein